MNLGRDEADLTERLDDLRTPDFFEEGFKRWQVSVNVVERSNPVGHGR